MPTNILIDLNIIIDIFLERKGFESSSGVVQLGELKTHTLYISAHIVSTLAYLLESAKVPHQLIFEHIDWLLRVFTVVPVDSSLLAKSLKSNLTDFEDAMIEQAAIAAHCKVIVTRNIKDFKQSIVTAQTPEELLRSLRN